MPNLRELGVETTSFTAVGGALMSSATLGVGAGTIDVRGAEVTGQFFETLGVGVLAGRGLERRTRAPTRRRRW